MVTETTAQRECPNCGSPAEPAQEYCLQCGHRLAPPPGRAAPSLLAAGNTGLTLLATAVIALVSAAVVATVQLTTDESQPTLVATSPQPTVVPTETEPVPEPAPTTETTTPEPPTTPPPPPADRLISWPAGSSGWTIVLASIPEGQGARASATRRARQVADRGLPQVGVLVSSSFSSLHPGYLVVFSGVYGSQAAAERGMERVRALGYEGYTRQITP